MEETSPLSKTNLFLCTSSNVVDYTIQWTVDNFSFYGNLKGEYQCLHSPLVPNGGKKNFWRLKLFPNGNGEKSQGYVSLYLYPNEDFPRDFITKATLSLVNGPKIKKHLTITRFDPDWGFSQFAKREDIFNDPVFQSTDCLVILCEIKVIDSVRELACEKLTSKKITTLQEDLDCFLKNQALCDASILVGHKKIKVHKSILAARSSVFAAMFTHKFQESESNIIKIEDVSPEIMENIVHYIYTDKFPKLKELVEEVLPIADKYALHGLKDMCAEELNSQLRFDTAAHILVLADMYSIQPLKENAIHFIVVNCSSVINTPSWKEMEDNDHPLVLEVTKVAFAFHKNILT